jgi:hypothetical protein
MAVRSDITADDAWFIGEDKTLSYEVLDENSVPVDVSGYALLWVLRNPPKQANRALLIVKTTDSGITITGVYNSVRASNTQRVVVTVDDTDTDALGGGTYECALKRTDDGSESVLSYGEVVLLASVAY